MANADPPWPDNNRPHEARRTAHFLRQLQRAHTGRLRDKEELPLREPILRVLDDYLERAHALLGDEPEVEYIRLLQLHRSTREEMPRSQVRGFVAQLSQAIEDECDTEQPRSRPKPDKAAKRAARQLRQMEDNHWAPERDDELVHMTYCGNIVVYVGKAGELLRQKAEAEQPPSPEHPLLPIVADLDSRAQDGVLTWGELQESAGLIAQGLEDEFDLPPRGGNTYALRHPTERITTTVARDATGPVEGTRPASS
ncbi:hypothetical protein ACIBCS_41875 [Streptomyces phaeochromogenes]|uniref:hypothetical protein n=1 Tax=Streptomyces phaeochromogenes TaxID=1923 RepID=UPI003405FCFB